MEWVGEACNSAAHAVSALWINRSFESPRFCGESFLLFCWLLHFLFHAVWWHLTLMHYSYGDFICMLLSRLYKSCCCFCRPESHPASMFTWVDPSCKEPPLWHTVGAGAEPPLWYCSPPSFWGLPVLQEGWDTGWARGMPALRHLHRAQKL